MDHTYPSHRLTDPAEFFVEPDTEEDGIDSLL